MHIAKEKIDLYQKNGVIYLKDIITNYWLEKIKIGIEKNFSNPSNYKCVYEKIDNKELFYDDYCNWNKILEYKNFLFQSGIANIASKLMISKKVNLFHEHVLVKEPGAKKRTPWHQDQSYYCVEGRQNISFWIPLDEVDINTSPEFIAQSHNWTQKFLPTRFFGDNYKHVDKKFTKIPNIEKNRSHYEIISYKLKPGDLIAFNFATIHGAPENKTTKRRRAFSARFTGDDARYIKRKGEMSPPFPEVRLKNGDKLDCEIFPLIPLYN